jgi:hypothetical protein
MQKSGDNMICKFSSRVVVILLVVAAYVIPGAQVADAQPVSIIIVRHAETDTSQPKAPILPLTAAGRQRAEMLAETLRGVRFTHIFASHTTRAREMVDAIANKQGLKAVQLPVPGTMLDGERVTDQTSRRAPIDPISEVLLKLPPGSTALVALNSENIFAILNRLGVPVAQDGKPCTHGATCVPCTDNSCYPRNDFDHLWHVVRESGRTAPIAYIELRYAAGWKATDR